jgi:aminopeptidase N
LDSHVRSDSLKEEQVASDYSVDEKDKRVTFTFPTTFEAGSKIELRIGFSGDLTGSMVGYYKSSYEKDGEKKYYSLTQFEVCFNTGFKRLSAHLIHSLSMPAERFRAGMSLL